MTSDPVRAALAKKYSARHSSRLVSARANEQLLSRRLAMLSVACDAGINIARYATDEELAALRGKDTDRPFAVTQSEQSTGAAPSRRRGGQARSPVNVETDRSARQRTSRTKVFVVHGRDAAIRRSMFAFLRAIGLHPVEWGEALNATGKPIPYIAETLDAALNGVAAVVVLLTPDDIARLNPKFVTKHDPEEERKPMGQARPNVLFEGGMAFARHPGKTVLVSVGAVKSFTDIGGIHITHLNNSAAKRSELVQKLRAAGADVEVDGRSDWYDAGDFEPEDGLDAEQENGINV